MKEFLQVLKRFVPPYKRYLGLSILFNILSAVLNIFSFAALIPILQILFQVDGGIRANDYMTWNGDWGTLKEVATNNLYYYIQEFIVESDPPSYFFRYRSDLRVPRSCPSESRG